jgi:hypothetical protein
LSWIRHRCGAIEPAPRDQHASGRTGIVAAVAQQEGVAQHRLVLAAARDPRTGGGGLERQAAPPRPGEGHARPHPAIQHGQRRAGLECGPRVGVGVGDRRIAAGPARHGRQHRQNYRCGGRLSGASHGRA